MYIFIWMHQFHSSYCNLLYRFQVFSIPFSPWTSDTEPMKWALHIAHYIAKLFIYVFYVRETSSLGCADVHCTHYGWSRYDVLKDGIPYIIIINIYYLLCTSQPLQSLKWSKTELNLEKVARASLRNAFNHWATALYWICEYIGGDPWYLILY